MLPCLCFYLTPSYCFSVPKPSREGSFPFKYEVENLSNDNCNGVFPELYAFNSKDSNARILIEAVDGTSIKQLPELTANQKVKLKAALVQAIQDMGDCQIADRGCQNILVQEDGDEFKVGMIDGDWAWNNFSENPDRYFDQKNLFYANMTYLSEHILIFSENNKDLFLDEILNGTYFQQLTDDDLIYFFLNPRYADNVGKFVEKYLGNPIVMKLMRNYMNRTDKVKKYKDSWKIISDFILKDRTKT